MRSSLAVLDRAGSAVNLTESTMTNILSTKGMRKAGRAQQILRKHRTRRRSIERGRNIYAKEAGMQETMNSVDDARDVVMAQLADQIFSKGHRFLGSATNITFTPENNPSTPLVALAGREKVGKTSLLRSLFRAKYAASLSNRTVNKEAMNFFNVGNVFNIVDLPGFGGTSVPWSAILQHAALLRNFARCQPSLKMLYYCMDVNYKHGVYVQDLDILRFLSKEVPNFTILITKAEQISENTNKSNVVSVKEIKEELLYHDIAHPMLVTSAYRMGGIDTLRFDMVSNSLHALPTERLTYTEAKRLSERLLSREELGSVRLLPTTPTLLDVQSEQWNRQVMEEEEGSIEYALEEKNGKDEHVNSESVKKDCSNYDSFTLEREVVASDEKNADESTSLTSERSMQPEHQENVKIYQSYESQSEATTEAVQYLEPGNDIMENQCEIENCNKGEEGNNFSSVTSMENVQSTQEGVKDQRSSAFKKLMHKVSNKQLMKYVDETSPWRNPLYWPTNVIPTRHPRSNIMRCPEDPNNPYLTQPVFVAPRADMNFRRPNVGVRQSSQKGKYEADKPLALLLKQYTIPYFPDIVDVDMHPLPWAFLGSRELYYEKNGARELAIRLTREVTQGQINPLIDNPNAEIPELTEEVKELEAMKYRPQISNLRPPEPATRIEGDSKSSSSSLLS